MLVPFREPAKPVAIPTYYFGKSDECEVLQSNTHSKHLVHFATVWVSRVEMSSQ